MNKKDVLRETLCQLLKSSESLAANPVVPSMACFHEGEAHAYRLVLMHIDAALAASDNRDLYDKFNARMEKVSLQEFTEPGDDMCARGDHWVENGKCTACGKTML